MDNMTGKEMVVLNMMIHISGYFTYLAMVWSHCSWIREGLRDKPQNDACPLLLWPVKNVSLLCLGHQKRGISFTNGLNYYLQLVDLSNDDDCADSHDGGNPS